MIETQLHHESIRMVKRSNDYVNNIALKKLRDKGYILRAHVSTITIRNEREADVRIRADGAIIKFIIKHDTRADLMKEIDRIYRSTVKYAEKYL